MPKTTRVIPGQRAVSNHLPIEDTIGWDALDMDDYLRVLIYGRTATGKTTLASTFPGPILWLICSGGKKPGEMRSIDTPEMRKKIFPKVIHKSSDVVDAIDYAESSGKYRTVVLDHLTGLVNLIVSEVKQMKGIPFAFGQSNAQAAKGMTLVTEQEWGFIGAEGIKICHRLLSLPGHCVIIAQQKESKPKRKDNQADMDGEDILLPFVGGQATPMIMTWLNPAVDFILGTFIRPKVEVRVQESKIKGQEPIVTSHRLAGKYEYCARTGEHDLFTTKFRVPRQLAENKPECIVDPTFEKIIAVSKGLAIA